MSFSVCHDMLLQALLHEILLCNQQKLVKKGKLRREEI